MDADDQISMRAAIHGVLQAFIDADNYATLAEGYITQAASLDTYMRGPEYSAARASAVAAREAARSASDAYALALDATDLRAVREAASLANACVERAGRHMEAILQAMHSGAARLSA